MHACKAKHEKSNPVIELYGDTKGRVLEGFVERFALMGHPKATHCYAWEFVGDNAETRYMAILELQPVRSPHTAVRAAIVSGQQK